ncbi:DUF4349 domain-containing protein [Epilithonimonas sp.]|uniref:DUF4349 domain-containing protein n=1 Tax=Epilithonimonas sp. TaxID=2894511 RepID=UPI002898A321|nr:DUF4349 domain-containing protein [Epilithonimonas sp.]
MKKLILTAVILSTLTMCKKAELEQANNTIANADSLMDKASETVNNLDTNSVLDSVNLKAKDLIKNKEDIEKAFENSKEKIDSISENVEKFKKDIEEKKISSNIDSIKNQITKEIPKATKTLTKVIYKDKPSKKENAVPEPSPMVKNGSVEINVDNISQAKPSLREIIRKYDGTVKTENLVSNDEFQTFYLTAKVPFEKFDYLVEDLQNLGMIRNKNLEVKGENYNPNKLGNLEITLYDNHLKPQENEKDKTFGEKSADAILSGWNVIGSILLFLLPFWPVFLIAGIGYYFYKKKNQDKNQNSSKEENNQNENL